MRRLTRIVPFADPNTHRLLVRKGESWIDPADHKVIATVHEGIPRFSNPEESYADSFGWQWQKWDRLHRMSQNPSLGLHALLRQRTGFDRLETANKTVLECGCGAGGDTEFLLSYPFSEVHAFDLSRAVDVVGRDLHDDRLVLSQASIYEMPYQDASFDFVYCHRVIQHTPDPDRSLRAVCRKVKPGGILFAHSYRRTLLNLMSWKYKYRWLTKRLGPNRVFDYVDRYGAALHSLCDVIGRWPIGYALVRALVPFNYLPPALRPAAMSDAELIELEKLITFDALTPTYDKPMSSWRFRRIIESEGFELVNFYASRVSVVYATARRLTT